MKKLFCAFVPPFQQANRSPNASSFAKTCTWTQFLNSARTDFKINLMQIATAFPISNGAVPIRCIAGALVSPASVFVGLRLVYCCAELQIIAFKIPFFNRFKTNPLAPKHTHMHIVRDVWILARGGGKNWALACKPNFSNRNKVQHKLEKYAQSFDFCARMMGCLSESESEFEINLENWFKQKLSHSNFFSLRSSSSSTSASFHFHDKTVGRSDKRKKSET